MPSVKKKKFPKHKTPSQIKTTQTPTSSAGVLPLKVSTQTGGRAQSIFSFLFFFSIGWTLWGFEFFFFSMSRELCFYLFCLLRSTRPTGEIHFIYNLYYYFLYDFVEAVFSLYLQEMYMIMTFVFQKVLCEKRLYVINIYFAHLQQL